MKAIALIWTALLLSASPLAAQPAMLLGPDLKPQAVVVRGITPEGFEITDALGELRTLSPDGVLRLSFAPSAKPEPDAEHAVLALRDGQAVVGKLLGAGAGGESFRVALGSGGREVELSLDDLMSVVFKPGTQVPAAEDDDVLVLATGETLVGFVEEVGDKVIGFTVGDADDPLPIPLERVHALSIANKPKPAEPRDGQTLMRVDLADGSRLLLEGVTRQKTRRQGVYRLAGRSVLPLSPPEISVPMEDVLRVEPVSGRYALAGLGTFEMELKSGGEVFGVPMPPRVRADGAIAMHAPAVVGFDLPKGAARLALTASLDLGPDIPHHRRSLAGCELVVYDGDERIGRCTLSDDTEPQRLNLPLKTGSLRFELNPGVNGPVLDRVVLTNAELLIDQP